LIRLSAASPAQKPTAQSFTVLSAAIRQPFNSSFLIELCTQYPNAITNLLKGYNVFEPPFQLQNLSFFTPKFTIVAI
jgi:hypothetical protein